MKRSLTTLKISGKNKNALKSHTFKSELSRPEAQARLEWSPLSLALIFNISGLLWWRVVEAQRLPLGISYHTSNNYFQELPNAVMEYHRAMADIQSG